MEYTRCLRTDYYGNRRPPTQGKLKLSRSRYSCKVTNSALMNWSAIEYITLVVVIINNYEIRMPGCLYGNTGQMYAGGGNVRTWVRYGMGLIHGASFHNLNIPAPW